MALPAPLRDHNGGGARRDLFDELGHLNRRLATLLDAWAQLPLRLDAFTPIADIEETPEAYLIEIELPGIKRGDVEIEISGRRLTISGERKEKERVGILRRRDRRIGQFRYEIDLPGDVTEDAVEANMNAGVLAVKLPKPETDKPRRILIS
jgi:HSP20 family protein